MFIYFKCLPQKEVFLATIKTNYDECNETICRSKVLISILILTFERRLYEVMKIFHSGCVKNVQTLKSIKSIVNKYFVKKC